MCCIRTWQLTVIAGLLLLSHGAAAEEDTAEQEALRRKRLEFLEQRFEQFELSTADEPDRPFSRTEAPLLRYSNPVRASFSDGATFLWLDGKRPVAAAAISIRPKGAVFREFTTLAKGPFRCLRDQRAVWTPQSGGLLDQTFPDVAEPPSSPALRLAEMRRLARRFTMTMRKSEAEKDVVALRLLAQPIYRWSDEQAGVVDGALFSFCETTDPEALVLVEAFRPSPKAEPAWRFTLARMTSRPLVFRLDEREIWTVRGYWANPRSPEDPYQEAPDGQYVEAN